MASKVSSVTHPYVELLSWHLHEELAARAHDLRRDGTSVADLVLARSLYPPDDVYDPAELTSDIGASGVALRWPRSTRVLNRLVAKHRAHLTQQSRPMPPPLLLKLALDLLNSGNTTVAVDLLEYLCYAAKCTSEHQADSPANRFYRRALGTAYLRLGEQENCQANHNRDSCLYPLTGGGVHSLRRGSLRAARVLESVLHFEPYDLGSRWLRSIVAMTLGEPAPLRWHVPEAMPHAVQESSMPRFVNLDAGVNPASFGMLGSVGAAGFKQATTPRLRMMR